MTATNTYCISLETQILNVSEESESVPVQQLDLLDGTSLGDLRGTLEAKIDCSPRREVAEVV